MPRWEAGWFNAELKKASAEVESWPKWMQSRDIIASRHYESNEARREDEQEEKAKKDTEKK